MAKEELVKLLMAINADPENGTEMPFGMVTGSTHVNVSNNARILLLLYATGCWTIYPGPTVTIAEALLALYEKQGGRAQDILDGLDIDNINDRLRGGEEYKVLLPILKAHVSELERKKRDSRVIWQ